MAQPGQLTKADAMSMVEFKRFLKCLRSDCEFMWEAYARLSFYTACRSSDVRTLRWADVLSSKLQVKEKKTKKTRVIPFSESSQRTIEELYELLGSPSYDSLIFKSHKDPSKPISIQRINQVLKEFKERYSLDIDHFSTHSFRKTFGRSVYDRPGDKSENLIKLCLLLNHSNPNVTKRYIGITDEELNTVYTDINL